MEELVALWLMLYLYLMLHVNIGGTGLEEHAQDGYYNKEGGSV